MIGGSLQRIIIACMFTGNSKPVSLRYAKWLSILVIMGVGWEPVGMVIVRRQLSST